MRRAREREEGGRLDLEILDPATGESIDADAAPTDRPDRRHHEVRARRLRLLTLVLALLAVASAAGAGHRVIVRTSLQRVERAWAEAMALDRARQQADDDVRDAIIRAGGNTGRARDDAYREALVGIGDEVTEELLAVERDLAGVRIIDGAVAGTRSRMIEALEFRRRQLTAERGLVGSTPLERADLELREQLDRFDLEPTRVATPTLRATAEALASVRRFAPSETDTVLIGSIGRRLLHIDLDGSRVDDRTLPRPAQRLLGAGEVVLVADGERLTAYPRRHDRPAIWSVAGAGVVAGRPGSGVTAWVTSGNVVRAVGADGALGPELALPPGAELLADTDGGLLARDGTTFRLHDPTSGAAVADVATGGRFVGASARIIAFQSERRPVLDLHRVGDGSVLSLDLPRTDAGPLAPAPTGDVFAFAAGPLAGNIASVLRLELVRDSWRLIGIGLPRATVLGGTITWSPSGHLYWITPEGGLGFARDGDEGAVLLRAPVGRLDQLVALSNQG